MKRWLSLILSILCVTGLLASVAFAIDPTPPPPVTGSEDLALIPDELSPEQEQAMWTEIQHNVALLRSAGLLAAPDTSQVVTYNFPLRMAPGLPDYAGFTVSAFVDHNSAAGQILDYNGGTRTYDGHRGTDYALWPFGWNKLDAGEVQVIAAAAGTIAYKNNTDATDHNPCDAGSGSDTWNAIGVVDAAGRMTLYGHLRYNSLTSKGLGQTVAQGEYLGTAASSGSSTGPHLHFEVRYGSFSNNEWIDPYAGPNSQPGSLWASQRPYRDSAINRLSTHSAQPIDVYTACNLTLTNLQDSFTTPARIRFDTYYRDYQGSLTTQLKIYRPDGSIFQSWQDVPANSTFYSSVYRDKPFDFSNSDPAGTWRFEAVYNGQTYETYFNLNAPTTITVGSPNGGEQWDRKATQPITWTDNLGGEVNIALYHNGVVSATLASNTASDGEYLWTPDAALPTGPGYSLRVTSVISPNVYDASDAPFALIDAPLIARDDFAITPVTTPVTIDVLSNDVEARG